MYTVTEGLKCVIRESKLDSDIAEALCSRTYITKANLVDFYKQYRPSDSLLQLIKDNDLKLVIHDNKESIRPKTAEFMKSMKKLRLEAKESEYQRLVNPTPEFNTLYETKYDEHAPTPAQAHKELKSHIATIFNVFISVASVVYAIWYWTDSSWGLKDSYRVLLCVFFGLLILVAEVVVYMGYLNKISEARTKERTKKEVKTVLTRNI